ncbi:MAG: hypothetical protein WBP59_03555 [Ilumatobacteraceae bacterium]
MTRGTSLRTALLIVTASVLGLVGCGGGDEQSATPTEPSSGETTGNAVTSDGTPIVTALGDIVDAAGAGDVLASTSATTRFSVVADQLDPVPSVEVDGVHIRFVFDSGSVEDVIFNCMVAGAFLEDGEVLTMVHPDGEVDC